MNKDNRILELEEVLKQMKNSTNQEELLTFPWVGNLGQWHWMVKSNEVVFNDRKVLNLGYSLEEIPKKIGFDYFTSKIHPDDYERVMDNMRHHLMNLTSAYEVEYRILAKNGEYLWYYDRGVVVKRDDNGKALVLSGIVFDITATKKLEEKLKVSNLKLEKLSTTDELTGAYNRRFIMEKFNDEIEKYKRNQRTFSAIMLDIDHFKVVNDKYGHALGDKVLQEISKLIIERIRSIDFFCRWGGEEFVILLPDTSKFNAVSLAEDLRKSLSKLSIDIVGNVTASFGVAAYTSADNLEIFLSKIDDLMYKAKEQGRNCVTS